jgi:hypothetical protein
MCVNRIYPTSIVRLKRMNKVELNWIELNILDVNLEAIGSMIYKTNYKNVIVSVEQLNTHCSKSLVQEILIPMNDFPKIMQFYSKSIVWLQCNFLSPVNEVKWCNQRRWLLDVDWSRILHCMIMHAWLTSFKYHTYKVNWTTAPAYRVLWNEIAELSGRL